MEKQYKILLVDDDEVTNFLSRETLKLYLNRLVTHAAHNGREALDFLLRHEDDPESLPDMILLDINMPVMDGWDFLSEFEKLNRPAFKHINIFMYTSSVYYEDINKARTFTSVTNIYSKPLDEEKIKAMVDTLN